MTDNTIWLLTIIKRAHAETSARHDLRYARDYLESILGPVTETSMRPHRVRQFYDANTIKVATIRLIPMNPRSPK